MKPAHAISCSAQRVAGLRVEAVKRRLQIGNINPQVLSVANCYSIELTRVLENSGIAGFFLVIIVGGASPQLSEEVEGPVVIFDQTSQNTFRLKAFGDSFEVQLDPLHPDATVFVSEQLYDGLVALDSELNPGPALAEYWSKDPEGLSHRFILRKKVRFITVRSSRRRMSNFPWNGSWIQETRPPMPTTSWGAWSGPGNSIPERLEKSRAFGS